MGHVKRHVMMNDNDYWWNQGTDDNRTAPTIMVKCECGVSLTLGKKDDHWTFHSDYCPLSNATTFYLVNKDKEIINE
jgi:hypothetical protein